MHVDFSFCIITDNSVEACKRIVKTIESIRFMEIPNYEILIIGGTGNRFSGNFENIKKYDFDESKKKGWITRKKNYIIKHCKYDNVVMMHDYFIFHPHWYKNYKDFLLKHNYDICCNPVLMIDGRRDYTDWTTYDHPLLGKQCPLPYLDWSCTKYQYINGGYFLVKKNFFINNPLDENLVSHGEEDVEWSLRVRDEAKIICNPRSYVCHIKKHRNLGVQIWGKIR